MGMWTSASDIGGGRPHTLALPSRPGQGPGQLQHYHNALSVFTAGLAHAHLPPNTQLLAPGGGHGLFTEVCPEPVCRLAHGAAQGVLGVSKWIHWQTLALYSYEQIPGGTSLTKSLRTCTVLEQLLYYCTVRIYSVTAHRAPPQCRVGLWG